MDDKKIIMRQDKFVDRVFGEEIEYIRIYTGQGIIVIFGTGEQIVVKYFASVKEVIEKYIEKVFENRFLKDMMDKQ